MVHIDVKKVRGKMAELGFSVSSLAKKLGINRNTLSSYLESPEKMPYSVVSDMAKILCDNADEATSIFFAPDLRIA